MTNSADLDQLASSEASWSGSTLFAKTGHVLFSKRRVKLVLGDLCSLSYYTVVYECIWKQRTHKWTKIGNLVLLSLWRQRIYKWMKIGNLVLLSNLFDFYITYFTAAAVMRCAEAVKLLPVLHHCADYTCISITVGIIGPVLITLKI